MNSLRLKWIEPSLPRFTTFAGYAPENDQLPSKERNERRAKEGGSTMPAFLSRSNLAKTFFSLMLLLLLPAATLRVSAQDRDRDGDKRFGDSFTPLVYQVENTGAHYPAPNFPPFAQLPIIRPLPDPFLSMDGWRDDSFTSWERRRNEIKAAVETFELGPKPDCHDCTITSTYTPPAAGSSIGSLAVNVTRNGKTLTLTSGIYIPQGMGNGPFPALIPMEIASFSFGSFGTFNFPPPTPPDYGSLPASVFSGLPIATVGYVSTQVTEYAFTSPSDHTKDPFYQLYPEYCEGICTGGSNQGEYAAWSWGVSRLIDGMEIATHQAANPLPIDMKHLAVTGCSFAGKMALYAGAFDERIALTIAQESGGGGATSWRVSHDIEAQGTVEDVDDTNYDWFAGQMQQFAGPNVYKMPVDQHELMAMVAPRALLETGNSGQYWLSNGSNYVVARATQKIYDTLGIGDRFGFYIDGNHPHCGTLPAESPVIASFVNKFMLGQANTNTEVRVYPNPADTTDYGYPIVVAGGNYAYYFPTVDYKRWTNWWGSDNPQFTSDWNTGGSVIKSLDGIPGPFGFFGFPDTIRINSGDTVEAGYELAQGGNHPASTVSLVSGANITADIVCQGGSSYTLTIPLPTQSYSIAAGDKSWQPAIKPFSPFVYQGSTTATPPAGASACVAGHANHFYFSTTGLSVGGDGNPGGPGILTTDVTDPLNLSFHVTDNNTGQSTFFAPAVTVNFNPLTSADSTNQNPVAQQ
ncbi:MAG: hypothetical protein WBQ94_11585 [Terracidiphilus sp.]